MNSFEQVSSPVADLRGVPPAHAPPTDQNFLNFMQFFGHFGKIVCWHPLEGWRPLLWGILHPPLQSWQVRIQGRTGGPLTFGFEAPKLSIFGLYLFRPQKLGPPLTKSWIRTCLATRCHYHRGWVSCTVRYHIWRRGLRGPVQ